MAYKAILNITGQKQGSMGDFDVLSCNFNFRHDLDSRGKIISILKDGLIHIELESSQSAKFFGCVATHEVVNGTVTFYKPDSDQKLKQLTFKNAFLVQYSETMIARGSMPMSTNITISAQEIELDGDKVSWNWVMD